MKKLKQIVTALVSVILAGTVTVNASAAESIETPYRSPTLSSFPSNASLEDLEKATDNEDLRIISSPSRGANYKTRAAEAVAYCGFIPLQDPAHHLVSRISVILGL